MLMHSLALVIYFTTQPLAAILSFASLSGACMCERIFETSEGSTKHQLDLMMTMYTIVRLAGRYTSKTLF